MADELKEQQAQTEAAERLTSGMFEHEAPEADAPAKEPDKEVAKQDDKPKVEAEETPRSDEGQPTAEELAELALKATDEQARERDGLIGAKQAERARRQEAEQKLLDAQLKAAKLEGELEAMRKLQQPPRLAGPASEDEVRLKFCKDQGIELDDTLSVRQQMELDKELRSFHTDRQRADEEARALSEKQLADRAKIYEEATTDELSPENVGLLNSYDFVTANGIRLLTMADKTELAALIKAGKDPTHKAYDLCKQRLAEKDPKFREIYSTNSAAQPGKKTSAGGPQPSKPTGEKAADKSPQPEEDESDEARLYKALMA